MSYTSPPPIALAIQYFALIATLSVVFWLVAKKANSDVGFWFVIGLALTSVTVWVNSRPGFADSVTHLVTAVCMTAIPAPAYVPLILFGAFNDERMLLALPFILFWKFPRLLENKKKFSGAFIHGCWILAAIAIWVILRHALTAGYIGPGIMNPEFVPGISQTLEDFMPYASSWPQWWWNVFMSFRWMWMLWIFAVAIMDARIITKVAFAISGMAVILSSFIVADVSRSICFSFGAMMVSVMYLARTFRPRVLTCLLMGLAMLQIFTPMGFFQGSKLCWFSPPLYKLAREFLMP